MSRIGKFRAGRGFQAQGQRVPGRQAGLPALGWGRAGQSRWLPGADHPRRFHQPSAPDASRKLAAFFDAHLKTRADAAVMPAARST